MIDGCSGFAIAHIAVNVGYQILILLISFPPFSLSATRECVNACVHVSISLHVLALYK